jgi:hypothetical protein
VHADEDHSPTRMAIAPDDSIWLTTATNNGFAAAKVSP